MAGAALAISLAGAACGDHPTDQGNGLFVDSGQRLGREASWGVALGDVDRDGDLGADLRQGNGIAVADFDRDGLADIDLFFACLSLPAQGWDCRPAPNLVWLNTTVR